MDALQTLQALRFQLTVERPKYDATINWSVSEYPEGIQEGLDIAIEFIDQRIKELNS